MLTEQRLKECAATLYWRISAARRGKHNEHFTFEDAIAIVNNKIRTIPHQSLLGIRFRELRDQLILGDDQEQTA